jgi:TrpR-related protein YerC/YecD
MRISEKKLNPIFKKELQRTLAQAICDLKDVDETEMFLTDFFAESEYEAFAKRLAIAYWLKKGRTYQNIKENLKVSSATVASVEKDMKKPGFALLLKKVEAEEWASKWAERIKKVTRST